MKEYKRVLIFCLISFVLFIILQNIYPVPNFTEDSKMYIYGAADKNSVVSYRPLGYSVFLKAVHKYNSSISVVVFTQYFLYLASTLFFLFTFLKVFDLKPLYKNILFFFTLVNPPMLFLANSILSDCLFISLTLICFALLIRILLYYRWMDIALMLLTLWCSFFVRYSVLVYPILAITVILLFLPDKLKKFSTIACILLLSAIFYQHTKSLVKDATGVSTFSGFGGWQLANNAMSVYERTPGAKVDTDDPDIRLLDSLAGKYADSVRKVNPNYHGVWDDDYMWLDASPFVVFKRWYRARNPGVDEFSAWTAESVILNKYGWDIIKQYPIRYSRYFVLSNAAAFFIPQMNGLSAYTTPAIYQIPIVQQWYGLPERISNDANALLPRYLNEPFRDIYSVFSVAFVVTMLFYLMNPRKFILSAVRRKIIFSIAIFWLFLAGFNILVAPVHYRFIAMLFPIILCGILAVWGNYRKEGLRGNPGTAPTSKKYAADEAART
jgi:hypothetical protein